MTSTRSPQLSIFLLPDGSPRAEAIGRNGTRRKIELGDNPWLDIMAELASQRDEQLASERKALAAMQSANIAYCIEKHPWVVNKVWHNGELVFARAWKRYLARDAFDSPANGKKSTKSTPAKRASVAVTVNMDEI